MDSFQTSNRSVLARSVQGVVDKFMGDCVMAVFRGDYHLDRAVDAALAIRKKIDSLPAELNFSPKVAIGIDSGEVVSGNIGCRTLKRLDYTVIGDVVNTTQRLQSAAAPRQILLTEKSYEKIKTSFTFSRIGEMILKNKSKPVVAYNVLE